MRWQSACWIVSKFLSPKRHNRGKTQWTIKSFILHDLKFHEAWWKSDKRCGSWSGQTDRQADCYIPPPTPMFAGGIIIEKLYFFWRNSKSKRGNNSNKILNGVVFSCQQIGVNTFYKCIEFQVNSFDSYWEILIILKKYP